MRPIFFFVCTLFLLASCVTPQQKTEQDETLNYYKRRVMAADSVDVANRKVNEEKRVLEAQLKDAVQDLEQLTATNISLNRSYQEVLQKYNSLVSQTGEVLNTTSYEKVSLQEELAREQAKLDDREQKLAQTERDLYEKENKLKVMEYSMSEKGGGPNSYDQAESSYRCRQFEQALNYQREQMSGLFDALSDALSSYAANDVSVKESNGKLEVSISQPFMFGLTSTDITYQGAEALRKIGEVFKPYQGINITVEGHTAADGTATRNWDISSQRALVVVQMMTDFGTAPEKLTAAAHGYFAPIATNATQQGKIQNMRTVLVFTPQNDALLMWAK